MYCMHVEFRAIKVSWKAGPLCYAVAYGSCKTSDAVECVSSVTLK